MSSAFGGNVTAAVAASTSTPWPAGIGEQRQEQVGGCDLVVSGRVGRVLGFDDDTARPRGEPGKAFVRVDGVGLALGHEPLLRGLLGDAHALADLGPGGSRPAGLVDEVADQVVGDVTEGLGGEHRVGELFEGFVVDLLDRGDEVVETDGAGDLTGLAHASTVG
jgi:hypothetical protein